MREKAVENQIKRHVAAFENSWALKLHGSAVTGKSFPDLLGSYRGQPFLVEVKGDGGEPSYGQLLWVERLRATGYVSGVVYSLDEFIALFNEVQDG
jgi:hypothetical protein